MGVFDSAIKLISKIRNQNKETSEKVVTQAESHVQKILTVINTNSFWNCDSNFSDNTDLLNHFVNEDTMVLVGKVAGEFDFS